MLLSIAKYAG